MGPNQFPAVVQRSAPTCLQQLQRGSYGVIWRGRIGKQINKTVTTAVELAFADLTERDPVLSEAS